MPDNWTMEQRVAYARNCDNLLDVVDTLEALDGHSCSSRTFRELATPLIQKLIEGVKPALTVMTAKKRAKPKRAPVGDFPPLDADAVGALNLAGLKALWANRIGDVNLPKNANNRVTKQSIIDALLAK
ncbi:MAG: hypothetical protein ACE5F1_01030 [Planctomycetota bacterium]